jgi:Inositol phospholipid synthesis and fat-storage-inducing TM
METRTQNTFSKPSSYYLLVFPVLLAVGSLFSALSPIASPPATPLAPGVTSNFHTPPTSAAMPNYFAGKHNIINQYFVKIGWFWTTLAFALLQLVTNPPTSNKPRHYIQSLTRYALITLSWFLTTQWLFGPPLIDRSFTITGGHCELPSSKPSLEGGVDITTFTSGIACKMHGGRWRGGHDISGHIFMLVLSSAFLFYEEYISNAQSSHPSVSPAAAAKLAHDLTEEEKKAMGGWESETSARIRIWSRRFVWAVVGLDIWMIMMTAIWFHTWLEKVSGLVLAAACIWGVYFLPDVVPAWREMVGGL